MKSSINTILGYLLAIVLLFVLSYCSKTGGDPTPNGSNTIPTTLATSLTITSISPNSGGFGTTVTITGTGFSTTESNNTVTLNNKPVSVISASSDGTTLSFNVPKGIGAGPVSVSVNNKVATGPTFFYVLTTVVSTLAGNGVKGYVDGKGTNAQFNQPFGIAVNAEGVVYVADTDNRRIRKIMPDGTVTTLAGDGRAYIGDGKGDKANFIGPGYSVFDAQSNAYISDAGKIRKVTPDGTVTTVPNIYGSCLAIDAVGSYYSCSGNSIRKFSSDGVETFLTGDSRTGNTDGTGSNARFNNILGITVDPLFGFLYVADTGNHRIRRISPLGVISVETIAGSSQGFVDDTGIKAKFNSPTDIKIGSSGDLLYIVDYGNSCIRTLNPDTGESSVLAGIPTKGGYADGDGDTAKFSNPRAIAIDKNGTIYVADTGNNLIRKISFE